MPSRARRPVIGAAVAATALVLLSSLATAPSAVAAPGADSRDARAARASEALDAAQAVFDPAAEAPRPDRDATLALRDLRLALPYLDGAEQRAAEVLLDRPTGLPLTSCSTRFCVHYTSTGANAATSSAVATTLSTMEEVASTYVTAGYRTPPSDGLQDDDGRFDVYLEDLGDDGIYGYCTPEYTAVGSGRPATSYCGLDNDFSTSQFPGNSPDDNRRVTAAHEFFHATQFAYDFREDAWLLEATATWVEDELYDDVDDNRQYVRAGPFGRPSVPLDLFSSSGYQYGTWIFFRHLTETYPTESGGLPVLVRQVWESAASASTYSLQAVKAVVQAQGTTLTSAFARFADANRRPATTYSEGAAYTAASPYRSYSLSRSTPSSPTVKRNVRHLSSSTVRFTPKSTGVRLKVSVNLHSPTRAAALVSVTATDGTTTTTAVPLDADGDGALRVPFSRTTVRRVEVTVANASDVFTCNQGTAYSCDGRSADDGRTYAVKGRQY